MEQKKSTISFDGEKRFSIFARYKLVIKSFHYE